MTDALEMREYRHARFGLHARDEALAAARNNHVDGAVEAGEHQPDRCALARRDERNAFLGQAGLAQPLRERAMDRLRGPMTFRAAAQDHGIARLEREGARIRRDVRPALIDDADDAERHAHALDRHAVRSRPGFGDASDRIGQRAHHIEAVRHGGDAFLVEREPVKERRGRA